jgi:hypothetical protein
MTLLATKPNSIQKSGVFRRNPKCRRMKKDYEAKHKQWKQGQIKKMGIAYYRAKQVHRKTCKTRTTKAVEEGFRNTIHKLQIELRIREVQTAVYKYPTQEDLKDRPIISMKALKEDTTLTKVLDDAEEYQARILELYQNEGIGVESSSEKQMTSEERGVLDAVANRKMRREFMDFYDQVLTDGRGQFIPDPLEEPEETKSLDLVFSHYYHIKKHSVSRYTFNIHLFLMDAMQRDPRTKLYPVYNKQTEATLWRQRPADYVGNLSQELSFVVEKFAVSGK